MYLLDANVFIQAARTYYAFDIAPRFWPTLVGLAADGHVRSVDRVKEELLWGKGELAEWAKKAFAFFY